MQFLPGESIAFIFNKLGGLLPPLTEHNDGLSPVRYLVLNHGEQSIQGRSEGLEVGGGVCAYLPDLKNIFEIYLNI